MTDRTHTIPTHTDRKTLLWDSGAGPHLTPYADLLHDIKELPAHSLDGATARL